MLRLHAMNDAEREDEIAERLDGTPSRTSRRAASGSSGSR
jgi:hypothetical protein